MKKMTVIFAIFFSLSVQAQELRAKPLRDLIEVITKAEFSYQGRAKLFGYNSIQSCFYRANDIVIFKNYCYPVRNYPAKGVTIISPEHGIVTIYQEEFPGFLKRDITIVNFPSILANHLPESFPNVGLKVLDAMMMDIYYKYYPGCWSTSFSLYHEVPEANCTVPVDVVTDFSSWAQETQSVVGDEAQWQKLMESIDEKLPDPVE